MKEKSKGFIMGVLLCAVLSSLIGGAYAVSQSITIEPVNIRLNGAEFHPKDANGNDVLVFKSNGTTYVPLRALSEAFGMEVSFDSSTNSAVVNKPTPASVTLGVGTYTVGQDITAGKYDVTALSGSGNFQGDVAACKFGSLNEILAAPGASSMDRPSTYSNLTLAAGDVLYIKGSLSLQFVKK